MSAEEFLPERRNLASLRRAAQSCQGCELYKHATQTVFGEGLRRSRVVLVGEVPGDQEDRQGKPFVGPAGRLLDQVLGDAGIPREETYVTNAVKHFKYEERGKRRLHKKPTWYEIKACRPWLLAEIDTINPKLVVCLGATAAKSLLGLEFRITRERGRLLSWDAGPWIMATYHPSAVLRAPEKEDRDRMRDELIHDLRQAAQQIGLGSR